MQKGLTHEFTRGSCYIVSCLFVGNGVATLYDTNSDPVVIFGLACYIMRNTTKEHSGADNVVFGDLSHGLCIVTPGMSTINKGKRNGRSNCVKQITDLRNALEEVKQEKRVRQSSYHYNGHDPFNLPLSWVIVLIAIAVLITAAAYVFTFTP